MNALGAIHHQGQRGTQDSEQGSEQESGAKASEREGARLRALERYGVLDSEPEEAFDRIVRLTQRLFKVPVVLISLVDKDRQWFKAGYGLDTREMDRSLSFCAHAIRADEVMVVPDAAQDARFALNPLVTGEPGVRFYAGAPLRTPDAYNLGTLCIIDTVPHGSFEDEEIATLNDLAAMVVDELELRLASQEAQKHADSLRVRDQALASVSVGVTIADAAQPGFPLIDCNAAFERLTGYSRAEVLGRNCRFLAGADTDPATQRELRTALRHKQGCRVVIKNYRKDATPFWNELTLSPVTNSAGEVGHYIGIQVDVTERKRAETQLAAQLAELKAAEHRAYLQATFRHDLLVFMQQFLQGELTDNFYQALLESAVRTIPGAQAGSILVKKGAEHHFIAAVGFDLQALRRCTFVQDDFLFDLNNPEPQRVYGWQVAALDKSPRTVMESKGLADTIAVTLCVPIVIDDQAAVSLYLDNFSDPDAFDADATEMARVLAQQAAALMQRLELEAALHKEQEALTQLAHYDPLTGLPNRRLFDDHLAKAAAQARRSGEPLGVMLLDLDGFKDVNDSYGHAFGDLFLQAVAARLSANLREGDTLSRWGGDEFVIIAPGLSSAAQARTLAERLLAEIHKPFYLSEREIHAGASIGIDVCSGAVAHAGEMVQNADIALYHAKTSKGAYQFFDPAMKEALRRRLELGEELRAALEEGALTLFYQPRIDLRTGAVTSLEALARWPHPQRGFVPPSSFIPLAEELGLIQLLGAQVLDKACAQAKRWQEAGLPQRVAVNVSVEQLKRPAFVAEVAATLQRHRLDPSLLELEITESTVMTDVKGSIHKLQQLREMGIRLAIDDFGTAYSSLAYLKRLPVHSLKIDRSFVSDLGVASSAQTGTQTGTQTVEDTGIIRAIMALACSLGLTVVAEGVETESQQKTLQHLGCHEAQGYLYAPPLAAEKVEKLLKAKCWTFGAPRVITP